MKLQIHHLTFLAEDLGKRTPPPLRYLAALARHPSPIVREGAVYGMAPHVEVSSVRGMLKDIAVRDENPHVQEAAREALE